MWSAYDRIYRVCSQPVSWVSIFLRYWKIWLRVCHSKIDAVSPNFSRWKYFQQRYLNMRTYINAKRKTRPRNRHTKLQCHHCSCTQWKIKIILHNCVHFFSGRKFIDTFNSGAVCCRSHLKVHLFTVSNKPHSATHTRTFSWGLFLKIKFKQKSHVSKKEKRNNLCVLLFI